MEYEKGGAWFFGCDPEDGHSATCSEFEGYAQKPGCVCLTEFLFRVAREAAEKERERLKVPLGHQTALAKSLKKSLRKWTRAASIWRLRAHHWKGEAVRARQGRPAKPHPPRMNFRLDSPLPQGHRSGKWKKWREKKKAAAIRQEPAKVTRLDPEREE
jgi:hypothetical protein